ncbi:MAG: hypothetical protein ACLFMO_07880 [Eubacteriales bacterium]
MGRRQKYLKYVIKSNFGKVYDNYLPRVSYEDILKSKYCDEVTKVYYKLGGKLYKFPSRIGKWDIETEKFVLELDEELHFNRYRKITLNSRIYDELNDFPVRKYKKYCDEYEINCLKAGSYGKKWTNLSCEKQFGVSAKNKDLTGNGSARWRQRAFYDYLKDLTPLILQFPLIRVSIWDKVKICDKEINIAYLLDKEKGKELKQYLEEKIVKYG